MPFQNSEIAESFDEIADILEIQGQNPFRVRAYRNAARVVSGWPKSFSEILKTQGEFPKIPGIGDDLAGKIRELVQTKRLKFLDDLRKETPDGLRLLLRIQGLGPKRVRLFQKKLKIESVEDLSRALRAGKVSSLPGLGPRRKRKYSSRSAKSVNR